MKKLFALLLILLFALPAVAFAAPGDALLLRQGMDGYYGDLRSIVEVDGTVYMLAYNALFTLEGGETEPVRHELTLDIEAGEDENISVSREAVALVAYKNHPCLVVTETASETEGEGENMEFFSTVEGAWLYELAFDGESNATTGEEIVELDWYDLIQGDGDYEYFAQCDMPFVMEDTLYFSSYDDDINRLLVATDLEDGDTDVYYMNELFGTEPDSLCAYKDGRLLYISVKWGEDGNAVTLCAADPAEGETEELAVLPVDGYAYPYGLAYRAETDTVYFIMNGELHAITGMDVATMQSVAEIPLNNAGAMQPIVTADGFYIAGDYEVVVRRNTDPSLRADIRLTVQDSYNTSIENAYYAFGNAHGDVEVIMTQQVEDIVQAMMNRSSTVDVYCLNVDSSEYEAVFSRGYMAELTESETIASLVESCYPFVQEVCTRDGEIVGVPVAIYMEGRGYDPAAFERLGMTQDDVPTTWTEFFESLVPLAQKAAEEPGMSLFDGLEDYGSARYLYMGAMIQDYMTIISQPGNELAFDTAAFREALAASESVDWTALGLDEPDESGGYGWSSGGNDGEHNMLYSAYADITVESYGGQSAYEPLLLSFAGDEEPHINASLTVAFVNPFSENRAEAIAFLETVASEMDAVLKIQLSPEENEPVRSPDYEATLENYDQMIADAKEQLDQADEQDKGAFEELVAEYEGYRENYLRDGAWRASAESIARYREIAPHILITRNLGMGGDNEFAFYELQQQYISGMISADEFINGVDGKLQMMMIEGM